MLLSCNISKIRLKFYLVEACLLCFGQSNWVADVAEGNRAAIGAGSAGGG